ncbi:MAG: TonB-dependent receptor, partial [Gammaproteobacteria bacterium]
QSERIGSDAQTNLDNVFGTSASLAPGGVNLSRENFDARLDIARGDWRLRAGLQRRRDLANGAGIAQALDSHNRYGSDRWNADLTYHDPDIAENWDLTAQISYLDVSQEVQRNLILFPPGANLGFGVFPDGVIGNPDVWERHARFDLSAFFTGFERHIVRAGLGFHYGDVYKVEETKNFGIDPATGLPLPPGSPLVDVSDTPFVFLKEGDRENSHIFIQDVWSFANDWELTAGVRYDDYSDFGDTFNPRLALVWSARHDLTAKLLYGEAFRAPAFVETRGINNPVALGNSNLDPETIETIELAFDYRPRDDLYLGLNLFYYSWEDIILFVPDPGASSSTAQNVGKQTGKGLELEAEWTINSKVRIQGNYAYQESTDEDTNEDAGNAPHHQIYLRADWEFLPGWHANSQINWVIDRDRVEGDDRDEIDDYAVVDLTIRRKVMKDRFEFAFAVRNLFDSDAREPSPAGVPTAPIPKDFPLAERNYYGEVRYNFSAH